MVQNFMVKKVNNSLNIIQIKSIREVINGLGNFVNDLNLLPFPPTKITKSIL